MAATTEKELYRSRPMVKNRDQVVVEVVFEVPKADITTGADGWGYVEGVTGGKAVCDEGTALSSVIGSAFSWSDFVEPTCETPQIDPRYRVGFALVRLRFVGSRRWAS